MDIIVQILVSGLTMGSIYAIGTIALSLLWGAMGMLNLAHGSFIAIGGYTTYWAMSVLEVHWIFALPMALLSGVIAGYLFYHLLVRWMYDNVDFSTNIIIATVALASLVENIILKGVGPETKRQPFTIPDGFFLSDVFVPWHTIFTIFLAIAMMITIAYIVSNTKLGYEMRAISQNKDAAQLMGININSSFAKALMLAGGIAAISGVLVTGLSQLYPVVGYDITIKAFIICIIAGLGNIRGSVIMAFILGLFEIAVQYIFGQRYGFPAMLGLGILVLLWRPYGFFGHETVDRV